MFLRLVWISVSILSKHFRLRCFQICHRMTTKRVFHETSFPIPDLPFNLRLDIIQSEVLHSRIPLFQRLFGKVAQISLAFTHPLKRCVKSSRLESHLGQLLEVIMPLEARILLVGNLLCRIRQMKLFSFCGTFNFQIQSHPGLSLSS